MVSVVRSLDSRLGRFFSSEFVQKQQRGPRAGPAPDLVELLPIRFGSRSRQEFNPDVARSSPSSPPRKR